MKNYFKYILLIAYILFVFNSCQEEEDEPIIEDEPIFNANANFIEYLIIEHESQVILDSVENTISITFSPDVTIAKELTADFVISEGASVNVGNILQVNGATTNNYERTFTYRVTAEDGITTKNWYVSSTNNDYSLAWGLGHFQNFTLSNNREYEWYLDQANTGTYSNNNCGPTATTMAAIWSNPDFGFNPEYARECYRPEGGWWYTSDIDNYLTDNEIPHGFIALSSNSGGTEQLICDQIDDDKVIILCLDMYYITNESNEDWHVDKFYHTNASGWGHFIVVKGYKKVDDYTFFEIYDSYGYGRAYSDETLKGIDRYYRSDDIFDATSIWWNYAIVISEKNTKFKRGKFIESSNIKHMWGR